MSSHEDCKMPASMANQITYLYFCTLGGLANPRCAKIQRHNGSDIYFTYHIVQ